MNRKGMLQRPNKLFTKTKQNIYYEFPKLKSSNIHARSKSLHHNTVLLSAKCNFLFSFVKSNTNNDMKNTKENSYTPRKKMKLVVEDKKWQAHENAKLHI